MLYCCSLIKHTRWKTRVGPSRSHIQVDMTSIIMKRHDPRILEKGVGPLIIKPNTVVLIEPLSSFVSCESNRQSYNKESVSVGDSESKTIPKKNIISQLFFTVFLVFPSSSNLGSNCPRDRLDDGFITRGLRDPYFHGHVRTETQ